MNTRRISPVLILTALFGAAVVSGQESFQDAIPDWPAPATWSPPSTHGVTTLSSPPALPFIAVTPCRQYDSRNTTPLPQNTTRAVAISGAPCGVSQFAAAVSLNVTVFDILGQTGNAVFQVGTTSNPTTAWINYPIGQGQIGNAGILPLIAGDIFFRVQQGAGSIDFTVDVNGYYAGAASGAQPNNTFLGHAAGISTTTGDFNTAIGGNPLYSNISGNGNTAIGFSALLGAGTSNNTAVGYNALEQLSTGSDNIGIGHGAGVSQQTGSHNIYIGNGGVNGESNTIRIGDASFQDGGTVITGISGLSTIGGAPVYVNGGGRLGTSTSSSRRFKQDIRDIAEESDGLIRLRPVAFRYKPEVDSTGLTQYGLIAEEVAEVYPDLVTSDREGRPEGVRYHLIEPLLLNEVQKQRRTIESQQAEIEKLKARLAALETRLPADQQP